MHRSFAALKMTVETYVANLRGTTHGSGSSSYDARSFDICMSLADMSSLSRVTLLRAEFFNRDPRRVARTLLGKLLIRQTARGILAGRIGETEAYLGKDDGAAHAAAGRTARNAVLFGPPGHAYVYFIYGNHYCLNVSCLPDGVPGGVLFRALEPVAGIEQMATARAIDPAKETNRSKISFLKNLSSGPGRLSEALNITRTRDNG